MGARGWKGKGTVKKQTVSNETGPADEDESKLCRWFYDDDILNFQVSNTC